MFNPFDLAIPKHSENSDIKLNSYSYHDPIQNLLSMSLLELLSVVLLNLISYSLLRIMYFTHHRQSILHSFTLRWFYYNNYYFQRGDLRLSGSIIRKSRFIFKKERRIIRQKSGCLNHSNERIFAVKHPDARVEQGFLEMGFMCTEVWGFALLIYLVYLKYPMKMK